MQAIRTKFIAPTNNRGARIAAYWDGGKITVPYDHLLGETANSLEAARALATRLQWDYGTWYGGNIGREFVWVLASDMSPNFVVTT